MSTGHDSRAQRELRVAPRRGVRWWLVVLVAVAVCGCSGTGPEPAELWPPAFVPFGTPAAYPPGAEWGDSMPVRLVAYGEASAGGVEAVAGARVAIVEHDDQGVAMSDFWDAVAPGASMWSVPGALPGYRVAATEERIGAAPAQWATTAADGTADTTLPLGGDYFLCAVAPSVRDHIAGCSKAFTVEGDSTVYVELSQHRAFFDFDDRHYRRVRDGGSDVSGLADVSIVGLNRSEPMLGGYSLFDSWLLGYQIVTVVAGADIGAFWDAVHDPARPSRFSEAAAWSSYGQLTSAPARLFNTGPFGRVDLELEPGTYLLCWTPIEGAEAVAAGDRDTPDDATAPPVGADAWIGPCVRAVITASQHNVFVLWIVEHDHGIREVTHEPAEVRVHGAGEWQPPETGLYGELLMLAHTQERQRVCAVALLDSQQHADAYRSHFGRDPLVNAELWDQYLDDETRPHC